MTVDICSLDRIKIVNFFFLHTTLKNMTNNYNKLEKAYPTCFSNNLDKEVVHEGFRGGFGGIGFFKFVIVVCHVF